MPKPKKKITIDYAEGVNRCIKCGVELDEDNTLITPSNTTGLGCMCYECQQKMFDRIAATQGKALATYMTACMLDVPLKPIVLEGVEDEFNASNESWLFYLQRLEESGEGVNGNKVLGFADGEQYLLRIFGASFTERDFAKYIYHERQRIEEENRKRAQEEARKIGTREQRAKWGIEPIYKDIPVTSALYDELDRQYEIRAVEFKGQTLTPQQEDTLIKVAKQNVIYDYLIRTGKLKAASDLFKSIDLLLASEQMRKKDEKPVESFRPDAWIDALEKGGFMGDKQFLPLPEIEKALIEIFRGRGYNQTLDCAHQLELNIINNAKRNADQPVVFELPDDMRIVDGLGEFAEEESDEEREAKEYAHLTPVRFEKKE